MKDVWNLTKKELDLLTERAKKEIEHPHFEYALIDIEKRVICIKRKPFWRWFSGKKLIVIKIVPFNIDNSDSWFANTNTSKNKDYYYVSYGKRYRQ